MEQADWEIGAVTKLAEKNEETLKQRLKLTFSLYPNIFTRIGGNVTKSP